MPVDALFLVAEPGEADGGTRDHGLDGDALGGEGSLEDREHATRDLVHPALHPRTLHHAASPSGGRSPLGRAKSRHGGALFRRPARVSIWKSFTKDIGDCT